MISIQKLDYYYAVKKQPARCALSDISLQIDPGTLFTLTGPNGGGKSTLFRLLCGLSLPAQGEIRLNGLDLQHHAAEARRLTGVVFQSPALDKHLTLLENFTIHRDLHQLPQALFSSRLEEDMAWTGLAGRLHERVGTLSGGMARRVELVKALLHRPKIVLMDEPTNGLDPGGRRDFLQVIDRLRQERQMTVLMTSHLFDEAERADQVGILHQGTLLAVGSPSQLRDRLGQEMVVIQGKDRQQALFLSQLLEKKPGLSIHHRESELRVEGIDSATLNNLLTDHREQFQTLSVKKPTLEDLFIHLTEQQRGHSS
ncbi:MAG: ABC transporter ATP-binding protein [Magnetococcales bacterium]|nr:ABC transporter ATP-binding protein [Magnetococcales bacterium]